MMQRRGPSASSGKWREKDGPENRYGEGEAREGEAGAGADGTPRWGPIFAVEHGP